MGVPSQKNIGTAVSKIISYTQTERQRRHPVTVLKQTFMTDGRTGAPLHINVEEIRFQS